MIKQMLSLEMLLNNEKMNQGFDFSFSQYVEQLKKHIEIPLDEEFKDLFARKFYTRYNSVQTIMDNFDNYIAMLETEFAVILPIYNKKYLIIKSLNDSDLYDNAIFDSTTKSTGNNENSSEQSSNAKSKSFGSSFPSEMVSHDSLEYATDGTHSTSEGSGSSKSSGKQQTESETHSTNKVGSRLDRMRKFTELQQNVFEDCLNQFKRLFIMIY